MSDSLAELLADRAKKDYWFRDYRFDSDNLADTKCKCGKPGRYYEIHMVIDSIKKGELANFRPAVGYCEDCYDPKLLRKAVDVAKFILDRIPTPEVDAYKLQKRQLELMMVAGKPVGFEEKKVSAKGFQAWLKGEDAGWLQMIC